MDAYLIDKRYLLASAFVQAPTACFCLSGYAWEWEYHESRRLASSMLVF